MFVIKKIRLIEVIKMEIWKECDFSCFEKNFFIRKRCYQRQLLSWVKFKVLRHDFQVLEGSPYSFRPATMVVF